MNVVSYVARNSVGDVIAHISAVRKQSAERMRWTITDVFVDVEYREMCIGRMLVKAAIECIVACNKHQPHTSDYVVIETGCVKDSSLLYFWSVCGFRAVGDTHTLRTVQW